MSSRTRRTARKSAATAKTTTAVEDTGVLSARPRLTPLLNPMTPVDWWFLFKFNSAEEPGKPKPPGLTGIFDVPGWERPAYEESGAKFSQRYAFASSRNPQLAQGRGILGAMEYDPLGSTFNQVYSAHPDECFYVVWNDQFYNDPLPIKGAPWGHSKGMLAWDGDGNGFVMQVSTPSWPASGNRHFPRQSDGNTLGYVTDDNIEVSQHFFALKVNADDVKAILRAMQNSSVVTGVATGPVKKETGKSKTKQ
ncbi:MAG: hypothetical protein KDA96_25120, partial [Planctomycetaceae bacterium]|nr:hypothetical protein [Planctomycetaceae bacterium]